MTTSQPTQQLASERVVVAAPMSLAGSAARIWKMTKGHSSPVERITLGTIATCLILCAWVVVLAWYCVFGLMLVPYRIVRRGARSRKRNARQHRELLASIERDAS